MLQYKNVKLESFIVLTTRNLLVFYDYNGRINMPVFLVLFAILYVIGKIDLFEMKKTNQSVKIYEY